MRGSEIFQGCWKEVPSGTISHSTNITKQHIDLKKRHLTSGAVIKRTLFKTQSKIYQVWYTFFPLEENLILKKEQTTFGFLAGDLNSQVAGHKTCQQTLIDWRFLVSGWCPEGGLQCVTSAAVKPDGFQPADSGDELYSEDPRSFGSPGKQWITEVITLTLNADLCFAWCAVWPLSRHGVEA